MINIKNYFIKLKRNQDKRYYFRWDDIISSISRIMRSKLSTSYQQTPTKILCRDPRYTQNPNQTPKSAQKHNKLKSLIEKYKKMHELSDPTIKKMVRNADSQHNCTEKSKHLFMKVIETQSFTFEKNKTLNQIIPDSHYNFSRTFKDTKIIHSRKGSSSSLSIFSNKAIQSKMGKNPFLESRHLMIKEKFKKMRQRQGTRTKEPRIIQCKGYRRKYIINKSHHNCVNWEKD